MRMLKAPLVYAPCCLLYAIIVACKLGLHSHPLGTIYLVKHIEWEVFNGLDHRVDTLNDTVNTLCITCSKPREHQYEQHIGPLLLHYLIVNSLEMALDI